ncbi:hypothetical protein [Haliangium sp.]|uniref:hypothetical protein n=1 Tax=Haliangium sp. TaxID=2663208 RepID=UPI003D110C70
MSNPDPNDWNHDRMAHGHPTPSRAYRQLDPGTYTVMARTGSGTTEVGMVFAEGTPDKVVVEHWVLSEGYASPTAQQSFEVVDSPEQFNSLAGFLDTMRTRAQGWSKISYIKATCEYEDAIPAP